MKTLVNKCVLVGISGSIAAYKSPHLVRRLRDAGAEVRVAMTESAGKFISALTMQAVSGHDVHEKLLDSDAESGMDHIELARWADIVIIAPASANCMARLANGFANDLLTTVCLATQAAIYVAPAMNQQMWQNTATRQNLEKLSGLGIRSLGTGTGDQACGETGPGRMLEPEYIIDTLLKNEETNHSRNKTKSSLYEKHITITAGPTWEALDPVRAITNASSGKMGYAVADAAASLGAHVTLISGPTQLTEPKSVTRINIKSAEDMWNAVQSKLVSMDIFIAVAAVADYKPAKQQTQKIKKDSEEMQISLVKNPDILQRVAASQSVPFTVGFAAETENMLENARTKLINKNVNMIAANDVSESTVFGENKNHIIVVEASGETDLGNHSKQVLAIKLMQLIAERYQNL